MAIIFLFAFLLLTSSAHATEISNPEELEGVERYERWLNVAEVPTPNLSIQIREIPDKGGPTPFRAYPKYNRISLGNWNYLYTDEYRSNDLYDRDRLFFKALFIHEIGHIWDLSPGVRGTQRYRYRKTFLRIMGRNNPARLAKAKEWNNRAGLFEPFAVAYSYCAFWPKKLPPYSGSRDDIGGYGYYPSLRQHKRVCRVLKAL